MPLTLSKALRTLYQNALKTAREEGSAFPFPLYRRKTLEPGEIFKTGVLPPERVVDELGISHTEPWKPSGLYLSYGLRNLRGLQSGQSAHKPERGIKDLLAAPTLEGKKKSVEPIIRAVLNTRKTLAVKDDQLFEAYHKWLEGNRPALAKKAGDPLEARNPNFLKKEWDQMFKDIDALIVEDVDGVKGRTEVIVRNPKAISLFWKDKKWPGFILASELFKMLPEQRKEEEDDETAD